MMLCGFALLSACESDSLLPNNSAVKAKPLTYFPVFHQLDDPDYVVQNDLQTKQLTRRLTGVQPRFSNSDQTRLLTSETSYFNGEIDSFGYYEYNNRQLSRYVFFNLPGADGVWQTADDEIASYHDHAPTDSRILTILYRSSGTDATWFTDDDDILYYYAPLLDAVGNEIGMATYTTAGEDGIWFTPDDLIGWLITENVDVSETRWIFYFSPGDDNDWRTLEDNLVYRYALSILDAQGNRERHVYSENPGADGLPFTPDDVPSYYHDYVYDNQGRPSQHILYRDPGGDGLWFTNDDLINSCKGLTRDANDLPVLTTSTRPGPDQVCFSQDDMVWGYHRDIFDTNNLLVESLNYYQPGVDGIWFNDDDVLIYSATYQ